MAHENDVCFCADCGLIDYESTKLIQGYKEREALLQAQLRDVEHDLRGKRSQITRMQGERDSQREMEPLAAEATGVYEYWKSRLSPRSREFTGPRFDAVVARLHAGHPVDELKRAIDGCAKRPYVTNKGRSPKGEPDERQADLELICRSEANVHRFISYLEASAGEKIETDLLPAARVLALQNRIDSPRVLARLRELRGWTAEAVLELGLGLDQDRIVFFVRDAKGRIVGAHRYQPNPEQRNGQPKQIAAGQRDLFPSPEELHTTTCWLVEGEPDAVAIRSAGLPGVGVPGVATWKADWTERFEKFEKVYVCFDCDDEGREGAKARARAIAKVAETMIVDLDPARSDHYDLGDLLMERGAENLAPTLASLATVTAGADSNYQPSLYAESPMHRVITALNQLDLKVIEHTGGRASSQCPNHDDRHPSMSLAEGDDGRVLIHCHAGCTTPEVVEALGLHLRELFPQR